MAVTRVGKALRSRSISGERNPTTAWPERITLSRDEGLATRRTTAAWP